jgi:DNA-binding NarL/FixJ family response regulator
MPDSAALPQVLVVDDHEIVRLGVLQLLQGRCQVADVATLPEARAWLAQHACELLLLDLSLGDDFGLAALPALREAHPRLKVIVLTSMAEGLYAERALRAGADGFVMKSALGSTLLQAVDKVLAGQVHVSAEMGSQLLRRMAGGTPAAPDAELSARELEVLRLVAAGKSTREIAELLNRSVKTIETHKQALKTKLGAETPAMLVRLAVARCGDAN